MKKAGQAEKEVIKNFSAVEFHDMQTVHPHKINLCPTDSFYIFPLLYISLLAGCSLLQ